MRQIDADTFEQELKEKLLPLLMEKYGKEEAMKGLHFSLQDCISNIQGQPTITQPERKTGKWILSDVQNPEDVRNGNYTYTCSNCLHSDIHAKTAVVPFCWHCGADMSGADMREEN